MYPLVLLMCRFLTFNHRGLEVAVHGFAMKCKGLSHEQGVSCGSLRSHPAAGAPLIDRERTRASENERG